MENQVTTRVVDTQIISFSNLLGRYGSGVVKPIVTARDKMTNFMKFLREEDGLETVEYAIIAGLIVVGTIVTIGLIGGYVATIFGILQGQTGTAAAS